jgi:hypothetical protein
MALLAASLSPPAHSQAFAAGLAFLTVYAHKYVGFLRRCQPRRQVGQVGLVGAVGGLDGEECVKGR